MSPLLITILTFLASYLVGGIPFGYLIARWRGVDIFQAGSGNIGATNVGRVLGRPFGLVVFLLDFAKGAGPVVAASWIKGQEVSAIQASPYAAFLVPGAGLFAFLGHVFPVYLRFRGGKGVATGAGVVSVLVPAAALGAFLTWIVVVLATRYVSLASMAAAVALYVLHMLLTPDPFEGEALIISGFCLLAAVLVFVRHGGNIRRLVQGTESRLEELPAMRHLARISHVLAVGLWFGSSVFFSFVVAPSLFDTFETLGEDVARPGWFRVTKGDFDKNDGVVNGPKEQGSRVAGYAVAPIFPWYFLLQGTCGLLAVVTCLGWTRSHPQEKVHKIRCLVLLLALATVLAGWPIEQKVSELRIPRNQRVDAYLQARPGTRPDVTAMNDAKAEFVQWHLVSLSLNFGTILLVAVAMALAARLPGEIKLQIVANTPHDVAERGRISSSEVTVRP